MSKHDEFRFSFFLFTFHPMRSRPTLAFQRTPLSWKEGPSAGELTYCGQIGWQLSNLRPRALASRRIVRERELNVVPVRRSAFRRFAVAQR